MTKVKSMSEYYRERAAEHYKEYKRYKKDAELYERGKELISIGLIIYDNEINTTMKVKKLQNGSNDFEASSLDGKVDKGYYFTVNNWEFIE